MLGSRVPDPTYFYFTNLQPAVQSTRIGKELSPEVSIVSRLSPW